MQNNTGSMLCESICAMGDGHERRDRSRRRTHAAQALRLTAPNSTTKDRHHVRRGQDWRRTLAAQALQR